MTSCGHRRGEDLFAPRPESRRAGGLRRAGDPVVQALVLGPHHVDHARDERHTVEEKFELIATGQGIALVPRSVARSYARPDLVYRPVSDIAPVETCLTVAEDRHEQRILDFMEVAEDVLGTGIGHLAAVG